MKIPNKTTVHTCGSSASRRHFLTGMILTAVGLAAGHLPASASAPTSEELTAARNGVRYLKRTMDQFHTAFPVYGEQSGPSHFDTYTKIPDDGGRVSMDPAWVFSPKEGATCIRCNFEPGGVNFGGYYFQNGILEANAGAPQPNFGQTPNAGLNLDGAQYLTFYARGRRGGERVKFFMGGVGRDPDTGSPTSPYPDSTQTLSITVKLKTIWQRYSIDLRGRDLRYVLGGFGWVVDGARNPQSTEFFIDRIEYQLGAADLPARLNQPRFLRSYTTLPFQPDVSDANLDDDIDLTLRKVAFSYDSAMAIQAFLADGRPDSLRRAQLIGDAFVYASKHDRFYTDGRIRTAYQAGDLTLPPGWKPNGRIGTVAIPGYYDTAQGKYVEVFQTSVDVGNNAWVGTALTSLFRETRKRSYLKAALRIGNFIRTFRQTTGTYQGFLGGLEQPETANPVARPYASTEHNLDCHSFFTALAAASGDSSWLADAEHAKTFVEAMFDETLGCYLTGTIDPEQRNATPGQLPLDAQAWAVLAIPGTSTRHPALFDSAEAHHRTMADGLSGFDFNDDKDGVWLEGTAQMAVAYAFAGMDDKAAALRTTLRSAQVSPFFGDGNGIAAASHDGVTTGFGFKLYRRLHVGATAWMICAMNRTNPYTQTVAPQ